MPSKRWPQNCSAQPAVKSAAAAARTGPSARRAVASLASAHMAKSTTAIAAPKAASSRK